MINLDSAIPKLVSSWRFIGMLISRVDVRFGTKSDTACTDGTSFIELNEGFMGDMSYEDVIIILAHETLHIVLNQTYRKPNDVHHHAWSIAEDIVINSMLDEHYIQGNVTGIFNKSNVTIHEKGCWPKNDRITMNINGKHVTILDIYNKTVHEIYDELMKHASDDNGQGDGNGSWIDDHSQIQDPDSRSGDEKGDGEGSANHGNNQHSSTMWHQAITRAAAAEAKTKGSLPGSLTGLVSEITEPKLSWRDILRSRITAKLITDTRYGIHNKRSCALGIPMPGYVRDGLDCVVHIDTSGSTHEDLPEFIGELKGIVGLIPGAQVPVIQCDAEINRVDDLMDTDFNEGVQIGGGGGTSHRPVIDYINKMETTPSIFISFTDGYSDIESCYGDLKYGIEKIIVMPKSSKSLVEGLSAYGEVLLID